MGHGGIDVDAISATTSTTSSDPVRPTNAVAGLGTDDFLGLLIAQLRMQDPLEPMGNQELLEQLAAIRDIQASTSLTAQLGQLASQQQLSSAAGLIGHYVTGKPGEDGTSVRGTVVGIRFLANGQPMLHLAGGDELSLAQVSTIESPLQAAESLIGQAIVGVDRRDSTDPEMVEGLVMAVRQGTQGELLLELDNGKDIRFRDVIGLTALEAV